MGEPKVRPIRKRMQRWEGTGAVRFITFSCHRRLPLLGHPAIRDIFATHLAMARDLHGFELYAWVVMPEHVHLIMRPRKGTELAVALHSLKTSVAKRVVARRKELQAPVLGTLRTRRGRLRFWQKRGGFDRNARDADELCKEIKYVHRNPVERELVKEAEEWEWSSVRWWMGWREGEVGCDLPPGDVENWKRWEGYR